MAGLLVRAGAAAGLIAGLLWALQRPTAEPPAACEQPRSNGIGECFGEALLASVMPYLAAMLIGMIVGAMIGLLTGRLLMGSTRGRRSPTVAGRAKQRPRAGSRAQSGGRWMQARYDGRCRGCGTPIAVGDHILHRTGNTLCIGCGAAVAPQRASQGPSPRRA